MVDCLLDTSVIIDLLRKYPPATSWVAEQVQPGISGAIWLEVLDGAQNRRAETQAIKLLKDFERIDPIPGDFDWAITQTIKLRLSHNVESTDCLIASSSNRLQLPLYTINPKHFTPLLRSLARKPY